MAYAIKIVVGLFIMEIAAAALWATGQKVIVLAFGVIVLANVALMRVWGQ